MCFKGKTPGRRDGAKIWSADSVCPCTSLFEKSRAAAVVRAARAGSHSAMTMQCPLQVPSFAGLGLCGLCLSTMSFFHVLRHCVVAGTTAGEVEFAYEQGKYSKDKRLQSNCSLLVCNPETFSNFHKAFGVCRAFDILHMVVFLGEVCNWACLIALLSV